MIKQWNRINKYDILLLIMLGLLFVGTRLNAQERINKSHHPRLLFQANELQQLANQRQTTHKAEWQSLLSFANKLEKMEPIAKPKSKLVFAFPEKLAAVALVQLLDPSQPYQDCFEKHFRTLMNWKEWDQWIEGKGKGPANDLGIAQALIALTACYDWQYQNFTPKERKEISQKLIRIAHHFYKEYNRFHTRSFAIMNCNHGTNVYAALTAVLYGADGVPEEYQKEWSDCLENKYQTLTSQMNTNMSDGFSDEGATYFMFQLKTYMQWFELRRNGLGLALGKPYNELDWFKNASAYCLYSILPGGEDNFGGLARYADANPKFWGNPYSVFPALGKNLQDPIAQWLSSELDLKEVELWRAEKKQEKDQDQKSNFDVWRYIWKDGNVNPVDLHTLPNWRFFEDAGMFVWRSSWNNNASYFTIKSGQHYQGHGHPDDGQFMIHRAGVPYIIDMGYSNPKYTLEHNVLLVNGKGQVGDGDVWCEFGDYPGNQSIWGETDVLLSTGQLEGADYFNLISNPTNMYPVKELKKWTREVIGWNGVFVMRDVMEASEEVELELLLHAYTSRKDKKDAYEYTKDRNVNPFSANGNKEWNIDPRKGKAPVLKVKDLSQGKWESQVDEAWFYDNYVRKKDGKGYVQLGNVLKRKQVAKNTTSLMFFGFEDDMKGTTVTRLKRGDGLQIRDERGVLLKELAWEPQSRTNRLRFDGEMAGIEWEGDDVKAWFGRAITSLKDKKRELFKSSKKMAVHALQGKKSLILTVSSKERSKVWLSLPSKSPKVLMGSDVVNFSYQNGGIAFEVEAGQNTRIVIEF